MILGDIYDRGDQVSPNPALASQFHTRGIQVGERRCGAGSYDDCKFMSFLYRDGLYRVPTDPARVRQYQTRMCQISLSGCRFDGISQ